MGGAFPCNLSHDAFDVIYLVNRMTDTCENIIFPQLRWRAVKIFDVVAVIYATCERALNSNVVVLTYVIFSVNICVCAWLMSLIVSDVDRP